MGKLLKNVSLSLMALAVAACSRLDRIEASPKELKFTQAGESKDLSVKALDQNGQPMQSVTFAFASADPSVASVDAKGHVTAGTSGSTTIEVTAAPDKKDVVTVDVSVAAKVEIQPSPVVLSGFGATATVTARLVDHKGRPVEGAQPAFRVEDESVARISGTTVTAVSAGRTRLIATAGTLSGEAELTVSLPTVESVAISPAGEVKVKVGEETALTAAVKDAAGADVTGLSPAWASSDPAVATVEGGKVVAVSAGTAVISASAAGKTAEVKVVVKKK